jgi:hypothetical protein
MQVSYNYAKHNSWLDQRSLICWMLWFGLFALIGIALASWFSFLVFGFLGSLRCRLDMARFGLIFITSIKTLLALWSLGYGAISHKTPQLNI